MSRLTERGRGQILRTFLPQQTADIGGGIYRVVDWDGPMPIRVDEAAVRRHLTKALGALESDGRDKDMAANLRRGVDIEVVELDAGRGVTVERYPDIWVCRDCKRIPKRRQPKCRCGGSAWSQLAFVGFHSCGYSTTPFVKRCPHHDDVRMIRTRSTKVSDLRFACPTCHTETMKGLGFRTCDGCGQGQIQWNVHKARTVYAPLGTAVINPPRPEHVRRLEEAGGARRALEWALEGMSAATPAEMYSKPTYDQLVLDLVGKGFDEDTARAMADVALSKGTVLPAAEEAQAAVGLHSEVLAEAEHAAFDVALAMGQSRMSTRSMQESGAEGELAQRYRRAYPEALASVGLAEIDLVEQFPILNVMYGFTRGGEAESPQLVPFRRRKGKGYRLYGELNETEALFFRLEPRVVATWLNARGHALSAEFADLDTASGVRMALIDAMGVLPPAGVESASPIANDVLSLIHSYAHRVIRQTAVFAGIDRDALSEYLVPEHLGFFVYAASRGDFVLGGLQALFDTELHNLLNVVAVAEHRCPLDPGCSRGSGACSACLHIGEPSCRLFNSQLDRAALFGAVGYLDQVSNR